MARKIKAKVSYKKNKKVPKAFVGAATTVLGLGKAIYGGIQAGKAKKADVQGPLIQHWIGFLTGPTHVRILIHPVPQVKSDCPQCV